MGSEASKAEVKPSDKCEPGQFHRVLVDPEYSIPGPPHVTVKLRSDVSTDEESESPGVAEDHPVVTAVAQDTGCDANKSVADVECPISATSQQNLETVAGTDAAEGDSKLNGGIIDTGGTSSLTVEAAKLEQEQLSADNFEDLADDYALIEECKALLTDAANRTDKGSSSHTSESPNNNQTVANTCTYSGELLETKVIVKRNTVLPDFPSDVNETKVNSYSEQKENGENSSVNVSTAPIADVVNREILDTNKSSNTVQKSEDDIKQSSIKSKEKSKKLKKVNKKEQNAREREIIESIQSVLKEETLVEKQKKEKTGGGIAKMFKFSKRKPQTLPQNTQELLVVAEPEVKKNASGENTQTKILENGKLQRENDHVGKTEAHPSVNNHVKGDQSKVDGYGTGSDLSTGSQGSLNMDIEIPDMSIGSVAAINRLNSLDSGIEVEKACRERKVSPEYAMPQKRQVKGEQIQTSVGQTSPVVTSKLPDSTKHIVYLNGDSTDQDFVFIHERPVSAHERAIDVEGLIEPKSNKQQESTPSASVNAETSFKLTDTDTTSNGNDNSSKPNVSLAKETGASDKAEKSKSKVKKKSFSFQFGGKKKHDTAKNDEVSESKPIVPISGVKKTKRKLGKFSFRKSSDEMSVSTPDLNKATLLNNTNAIQEEIEAKGKHKGKSHKTKTKPDKKLKGSASKADAKRSTPLLDIIRGENNVPMSRRMKDLIKKGLRRLTATGRVRSVQHVLGIEQFYWVSDIALGELEPQVIISLDDDSDYSTDASTDGTSTETTSSGSDTDTASIVDDITYKETDCFDGVSLSDLSLDGDLHVSHNPAGSDRPPSYRHDTSPVSDLKLLPVPPTSPVHNKPTPLILAPAIGDSVDTRSQTSTDDELLTSNLHFEPPNLEDDFSNEYAEIVKIKKDNDLAAELHPRHHVIAQVEIIDAAKIAKLTEDVSNDATNDPLSDEKHEDNDVNVSDKNTEKEANERKDYECMGYSNQTYSDDQFQASIHDLGIEKEMDEDDHGDESDAYVQLQQLVNDYNTNSGNDKDTKSTPNKFIMEDELIYDNAVTVSVSETHSNAETDTPTIGSFMDVNKTLADLAKSKQPRKVIIMREVAVQAPDIHMPLDMDRDFGLASNNTPCVSIGIQVPDCNHVEQKPAAEAKTDVGYTDVVSAYF